MNTRKTEASAATSGAAHYPWLELLLLYEDGPTGLRGKLALDHVLSSPEVVADAKLHVWRLDVLRYPACHAEATRDAFDADIMVVSTHGHNRLAPETEASLNQWVGLKRNRPCVLVISLDADDERPGESHPALRELRAEAARNGLTVLLQFAAAPSLEMNPVIADIRRRADTTSQVLEQILHRPEPFPRWGINE